MTAYTFDQLITFTRTSAATYVGSNGLVAVTPASRNLLIYTQEFDNAAWTKANASAYSFDPATATYGAELVTNGNFSGGATGWTLGDWVISGGQASATATSTSLYGGQFTPVAGRVYRVEFDIISYASGTLSVTVGGNFTTNANLTGAAAAPGRKSVLVTAGSNPARAVEFYGGSVTATIDNISVREVIGGLITAPDGTLTGDALIEDTTNAAHSVSSGNATVALGAVTWSVYAKAGTRSWMWLNAFAGGNNRTWFNLANGTVGTTGAGATASITSVGNGWYRCAVTLTSGTTTVSMGINAASADNTTGYAGTAGATAIYLWGAQLEAASAASTYTRNNGGVYPPRFDYDPVTRAPRGLLIEEQRTNLLLRSEEFDNAVWSKSGATVTANAAVSPDGANTADKLVEDTGNSQHFVVEAFSITSGTTYTFSVYAKAAERTVINLFGSGNLGGTAVRVNLTDGSVQAGSATVTPAGGGFYRISYALTATATGSGSVYIALYNGSGTYLGDGTSGVYLWGAQLEAGPFATSYIPTVASQVTRTADQASVTAPMFAPWYRQSEGTFVVQAQTSGDVLSSYSMAFRDAAYVNTIGLDVDASGAYRLRVTDNSVNQVLLNVANPIAANTVYKVAAAYKANDFAASANGGAASSDTVGTVPSVEFMVIGAATQPGAISWNGHIQSIDYYPTRLTNAQIQALTA